MPSAAPSPRPAHVLFFAAVPPEPVAERIAEAWRGAGTRDGFRAATLHLSLLAAAELDRPDPQVTALLQAAAEGLRSAPFELRFDRIVTFGQGPGNHPIVLTVPERSAAVDGLAAELHRAATDAGLALPRLRRITPHVTLAYGRGFAGRRYLTQPVRWTVQEVTLIDSPQGEGRHIPLGRWPLG